MAKCCRGISTGSGACRFTHVHRGEFYLCHATPQDDNRYWLEEVLEDGSVRRKSLAEIEALAQGIAQPVILFAHSHLRRCCGFRTGG